MKKITLLALSVLGVALTGVGYGQESDDQSGEGSQEQAQNYGQEDQSREVSREEIQNFAGDLLNSMENSGATSADTTSNPVVRGVGPDGHADFDIRVVEPTVHDDGEGTPEVDSGSDQDGGAENE
jgi:hypothetical protein